MKTKLILEFGCNHQGNISIAKKMIDEAANLNVWAVKFQKRDLASIPKEIANKKRDMSLSFGETYLEHRKVLEFDLSQLEMLKAYAESKGLIFICSAFDHKSIIDLIELKCEYIKLPSQLYTDKELKDLLLACKKKHKTKILLSTGMHCYDEIVNNDWLENVDYLFHCISVYPHDIKKMNLIFLSCLTKLSNKYNFIPGYSSHDYKGMGIHYAVIAGAQVVERHYTLNKQMKGSDHSTVSSDYAEVQKIITDIGLSEEILGNEKRECSQAEIEIRKVYRGF